MQKIRMRSRAQSKIPRRADSYLTPHNNLVSKRPLSNIPDDVERCGICLPDKLISARWLCWDSGISLFGLSSAKVSDYFYSIHLSNTRCMGMIHMFFLD